MRNCHAIRLVILVAALLMPSLTARAQLGGDSQDLNRAWTLYQKNDAPGALALAESMLSKSPDNENALYASATFNFHMRNVDAARGRLERLIKLAGNNFGTWQLMIQVAQAQGDLARRDEAVDRVKIVIRTAIDPQIRAVSVFVRDSIPVGKDTLSALDFFDRGGSDFTRYQFALGDPRLLPDKGLLLRTDAYTTETWADTALLPQDKQLFHLDLIDPKPEGGQAIATYQYYVGEPDYDTVRAKVIQILRGEAQPLSGSPGSLQGILKRD